MSKWKLSEVMLLGTAQTASENCTLGIARAVKRFLTLVGIGTFSDEPFVLLAPPGMGIGDNNRVPLSAIEGPIPEDLQLHWNVMFSLEVGGETYTNTVALASIPKRLTDYGDLTNSLAHFIRELTQIGETQKMPQIIGSAEGLALYWAMSFGYPYPLTQAPPPPPPPVVPAPAPYEPAISPVGEEDDPGEFATLPGSQLYPNGAKVKEARGVFIKRFRPGFGGGFAYWAPVQE
jgi:hypothetical protein